MKELASARCRVSLPVRRAPGARAVAGATSIDLSAQLYIAAGRRHSRCLACFEQLEVSQLWGLPAATARQSRSPTANALPAPPTTPIVLEAVGIGVGPRRPCRAGFHGPCGIDAFRLPQGRAGRRPATRGRAGTRASPPAPWCSRVGFVSWRARRSSATLPAPPGETRRFEPSRFDQLRPRAGEGARLSARPCSVRMLLPGKGWTDTPPRGSCSATDPAPETACAGRQFAVLRRSIPGKARRNLRPNRIGACSPPCVYGSGAARTCPGRELRCGGGEIQCMTQRPKRSPFVHCVGHGWPLCLRRPSGALLRGGQSPARRPSADSNFERGFEDQLGRILAYETVNLGKHVLFQGVVPADRTTATTTIITAIGYRYDRHDRYYRHDRYDRRHRRNRKKRPLRLQRLQGPEAHPLEEARPRARPPLRRLASRSGVTRGTTSSYRRTTTASASGEAE